MNTITLFKIRQKIKCVNDSFIWVDIDTIPTNESHAWDIFSKVEARAKISGDEVVLVKITETRIS